MRYARLIMLFAALAALWVAQRAASATDISDFAIYGVGDVKVGGSVLGDVGSDGGNVHVQSSARVFGDAVAQGGISVASRGIVFGDATAGGAIKVKGSVEGTVTPLAGPATLDPLLAGGLLPVTSFSAGGTSYKGKYGTLDLAPGTYGAVNIKGAKGGGELNLSSGDYYFSSLTLKGITLYLDQSAGAVNIYVKGNVQISKSGLTTGEAVLACDEDGSDRDIYYGADLVYMETHGSAKLIGSQWLGTIYAPEDRLTLANTSLIGALYSGDDIVLSRRTSLIYLPLWIDGGDDRDPGDEDGDGDGGGGTPGLVPEPGTLALLGTSLMGVLVRTISRRKRSA